MSRGLVLEFALFGCIIHLVIAMQESVFSVFAPEFVLVIAWNCNEVNAIGHLCACCENGLVGR